MELLNRQLRGPEAYIERRFDVVTLRLLCTGHESGWYSARLLLSSYRITELFSPYTVNTIELRLSEYQVLPLVQLFVIQFIQLVQLVLGGPRNSA